MQELKFSNMNRAIMPGISPVANFSDIKIINDFNNFVRIGFCETEHQIA